MEEVGGRAEPAPPPPPLWRGLSLPLLLLVPPLVPLLPEVALEGSEEEEEVPLLPPPVPLLALVLAPLAPGPSPELDQPPTLSEPSY